MISMPKQLIHFEKVLSSLLRTVWSVLDRTPRELLHEVSDQKYFVDLQKASPHNEKNDSFWTLSKVLSPACAQFNVEFVLW